MFQFFSVYFPGFLRVRKASKFFGVFHWFISLVFSSQQDQLLKYQGEEGHMYIFRKLIPKTEMRVCNLFWLGCAPRVCESGVPPCESRRFSPLSNILSENTNLPTTTAREQNRALGPHVYGRYPNPTKRRRIISTIAFPGSAKISAPQWWWMVLSCQALVIFFYG